MAEQKTDILADLLGTFDTLKLGSIHERRMAIKPLWDFFQILLKETGVVLLGLDRNTLERYHLSTRWENVKIHLSYVEDPKTWDNLVNEMCNIRKRVEHNDHYDPKASRLKKIREKAPEFKQWVIRVARAYYEKSNDFTFKQSFYRMLKSYVMEADWVIREYGEKTPHVAESDFSFLEQKDSYTQLKELAESLRHRIDKASTTDDLDRSDLDNLIKVVKIVSKIRGREEVLLTHSVCPKCGGKIVETQRSFGFEDLGGIVYRIGCEKCDYEVHSETIGF